MLNIFKQLMYDTEEVSKEGLILEWDAQQGIGFLDIDESQTPYDQAYFDKYKSYEGSENTKKLNDYRVEFVLENTGFAPMIDIGVGAGTFITHAQARGIPASGFDVNHAGVRWLEERNLFVDPLDSSTQENFRVLAFWDSLEHIKEPELLWYYDHVYVSTPIYEDLNHVMRSKHFRPDEHCWYFTRDGIVNFMREYGYRMVYENTMEQDCGREDIGSFFFTANHMFLI